MTLTNFLIGTLHDKFLHVCVQSDSLGDAIDIGYDWYLRQRELYPEACRGSLVIPKQTFYGQVLVMIKRKEESK